MDILFSSRAGIALFGGGAFCRADWPLGKITLDREALTLDALFKSYRLSLADIDSIRPGLLSVEIPHHAHGVPESVQIWGFFLFRRLRKTIHHHQLKVEVTV